MWCDVSLLQPVKQQVCMCHDLVKKCQEKTKIFIFQHSLKTPSLSHSCCIKFTFLSDGMKTLQECSSLSSYMVLTAWLWKFPPCCWSSRTSVCHHFIQHSGSRGWPGEKCSKSTKIWQKSTDLGDVRCCLLHYQVQLMSITVYVAGTPINVLNVARHPWLLSSQQLRDRPGRPSCVSSLLDFIQTVSVT